MDTAPLNDIYAPLKIFFDKRKARYIGAQDAPVYAPADLMKVDNLQKLLDKTHNMMGDVLKNKNRIEIERTYEASNLMLALGRDHMNAAKTRITRCVEQANYVRRALKEGSATATADGFLMGNIKKASI